MKRFRYICVSGEDDRELVLGGIGTYLGLLTRFCSKEYPQAEIHWVIRSPDSRTWSSKDENGVHRHYLSPNASSSFQVLKTTDKSLGQFSSTMIFNTIATKKVLSILREDVNLPTIIESGEWEGHGSELFSVLSEANILRVARLHTPLATCIKQNRLHVGFAEIAQLWREYLTLQNADLLSASTNYVKKRVVEDVFGSIHKAVVPIVTIPNPVDTEIFRPEKLNRKKGVAFINKLLGQEFFNNDTFNIVVIGSVEYRKGANLVVDAFSKLSPLMPNARLCFVGRTAEQGERKNANKKLSPHDLCKTVKPEASQYIRFTGYVEHKKLPSAIAAGDIFPIFSLGDNFPGVVAEISLCGKPIIAFQRGGVKEMLSDKRGEFLAVDLGNDLEKGVELFKEEILKLYKDKDRLEQIGLTLRKLILHKYEPSKITRQLYGCYLRRLEKKCLTRKRYFFHS